MRLATALCKCLPLTLAAALPLAACAQTTHQNPWQSQTFSATNSLNQARSDALFCIPLAAIGVEASQQLHLSENNQTIPSQAYDCDGDGAIESLAAISNFKPKEQKQLVISWLKDGQLQTQTSTTPRTYAELAIRINASIDDQGLYQGGQLVGVDALTLPANHTIGNRLFKYEGLGWESELVAYRWYFDTRSAIDIFGKTQTKLSLAQVGLDGGDYHSLSDWGMDILKVGPSLGLGSVGHWSAKGLEGLNTFDRLQAKINNDMASGAALNFTGWQTQSGKRNVEVRLDILPGSLLTRVSATASSPLPNWATGIVRHGLNANTSFGKNSKGKWQYLSTWGKQSLADDNLGMAVFFQQKDVAKLTEDDANHLVVLKGGQQIHYYFAAFWRLPGIDDEKSYGRYLDRILSELNNPIRVDKNNP